MGFGPPALRDGAELVMPLPGPCEQKNAHSCTRLRREISDRLQSSPPGGGVTGSPAAFGLILGRFEVELGGVEIELGRIGDELVSISGRAVWSRSWGSILGGRSRVDHRVGIGSIWDRLGIESRVDVGSNLGSMWSRISGCLGPISGRSRLDLGFPIRPALSDTCNCFGGRPPLPMMSVHVVRMWAARPCAQLRHVYVMRARAKCAQRAPARGRVAARKSRSSGTKHGRGGAGAAGPSGTTATAAPPGVWKSRMEEAPFEPGGVAAHPRALLSTCASISAVLRPVAGRLSDIGCASLSAHFLARVTRWGRRSWVG